MEELVRLTKIVTSSPGLTTVELRDRLRRQGRTSITTADVARTLTGSPHLFHQQPGTHAWTRSTHPAAEVLVVSGGRPLPPPSGPALAVGFPLRAAVAPLYQWQTDALHAWAAAGSCGVVEAVTGTGKTRVGVTAALAELARGGQVLVLVPTRELLLQWHAVLTPVLPPGLVIGLLGDGHAADLADCDVLISVVNSARDRNLRPRRPGGLLVADECHRYATHENRRALTEAFPHRLGLSATFARPDDGHLAWLTPYFGSTCYRLGYVRAARDRIIAPFDITLLSLDCTQDERATYDELTDRMRSAGAELHARLDLPDEPAGAFLAAVASEARHDTRLGAVARSYLAAMQARRRLLDDAEAKRALLWLIAPAIASAQRTLIFTSTVASAQDAAMILSDCGLRACALHSHVSGPLRRDRIAAFRSGELRALIAPQVLDEGIDVPDADLAIVLGATRSHRQMVQRMGRIIRRKPDNRRARFVIAYLRSTIEDPAAGAHQQFLAEAASVANSITTYDPTVSGWRATVAHLQP